MESEVEPCSSVSPRNGDWYNPPGQDGLWFGKHQ